MTDISIGQYFPGSSPIHKMDPRTKILLSVIFMVVIFTVKTVPELLAVSTFAAATVIFGGVPLRYYIKGLKPIFVIMLITAVLNLFLTSGEVIFTVPYLGLKITDNGVKTSAFMVARLTLLFTATSALTFTTAPVALTNGIEALLRPFSKIGVPSHEIAMMMTIALRFIPTFAQEAEKIKMAQSARGADFESGNIFARAKAMIPILVPLFVGAFRRADELASAMEARCYKGGEGRTSLKLLKFGKYDAYALSALVLLAIFLIISKVLYV